MSNKEDEEGTINGTMPAALHVQLVTMLDTNEDMMAMTIDHTEVYMISIPNALRLCDAIHDIVQRGIMFDPTPSRKDN